MEVLRISEFAGLRDGVAPADVPPGGAWHSRNVDFRNPRALRSLPGRRTALGAYDIPSEVWDALCVNDDLAVLRSPNVVDILNAQTGASVNVGNTIVVGSGFPSIAEYRSPTEKLIWLCASGQAPEQWETVANAWTTPTATVDGVAGRAMPKMMGAVQSAIDQRFLAWTFSSGLDGPHGAQSYPWRVWASEPGLPKTWTTTRYFDLFPAQGDPLGVMAGVSWNGKVFFFTTRYCMVLHSVSTTAGGVPVFNTYDIPGAGLHRHNRHACAGDLGVYFVNDRGFWRTTGGGAELLSGDQLAWVLNGGSSHPFGLPVISADSIESLRAHKGRVYMTIDGISEEGDEETVVYDELTGLFSVIDEMGIPVEDSNGGVRVTPHPNSALQRIRTLGSSFTDGWLLTLPFQPADGEHVIVRRVVLEGAFAAGELPSVTLRNEDAIENWVGAASEALSNPLGENVAAGNEMPGRFTYNARTRGRAFMLRLHAAATQLRGLTSIEIHFEPTQPRLAKRQAH